MKYTLNPLYEKKFQDFFLNIQTYFQQNNNSIHKARNELKIISYKNEEFVVKSFKVPNLLRRIFYTFFRDTKAKKSYDYSIKIASFTPEPIGYIEFYKNALLDESYFIAKKFAYDFTIKEPITNKALPDRDTIFQAFANFTYDLHQNKILHKDYSPGNILVKKENDDYIFKIVDINRMEFRELSLDERLKNFAKLWLLDEDLITIVKAYAKLVKEEEEKCIQTALKYSHALKRKVNMKKRLKGIEVVD